MQNANANCKCKMQTKNFCPNPKFCPNLKFSPKPISLSGTKKRFYSPMQTFSLAPAWAECNFFYWFNAEMPMEEVPLLSLFQQSRPTVVTKPPHPAMLSKSRPILLCYLKMLVGNIWIGNSNAKCKRRLQLQKANLNFLTELKILLKT